jgi:hypothetical protein
MGRESSCADRPYVRTLWDKERAPPQGARGYRACGEAPVFQCANWQNTSRRSGAGRLGIYSERALAPASLAPSRPGLAGRYRPGAVIVAPCGVATPPLPTTPVRCSEANRRAGQLATPAACHPAPAARARAMISIPFSEPHWPVLFLQDHWHPVVELIHLGVRPRRHDCEATMLRFIRPAEALPDACEGKWPSVLPRDRVGLLAAFDHLPLIECIRVHDAAPSRQGAPEHPGLDRGVAAHVGGIAARVDRALCLRRFLSPIRRSSPFQQIEVTFRGFRMPPDHQRALRRRDVRASRDAAAYRGRLLVSLGPADPSGTAALVVKINARKRSATI